MECFLFSVLVTFLRLVPFLKLIKIALQSTGVFCYNILASRTGFMECFSFAAQLTAAKLVTMTVGTLILFLYRFLWNLFRLTVAFSLAGRSMKWIGPIHLLRNVLKSAKITGKGEFAEQWQGVFERSIPALFGWFATSQHCHPPSPPCPDANECITNGAWTCRNAMLGNSTLSLHADALQSALGDN